MRLAFPDHKTDVLWGGADLIDLSDSLYMVNDFREIAPCFQEAGFSNDARLWAIRSRLSAKRMPISSACTWGWCG